MHHSSPAQRPAADLSAAQLRRRKMFWAAVALAALGVTAVFAWQSFTPRRSPLAESQFIQLDRQPIAPARLQSKVVLINFWATSCASCVAEMPDLVTTHEKYKNQGYETVAVAMAYDSPQFVQQFAQSRRLPFLIAFDNSGALAKQWGDIKLTPTTFLVDRQGRIAKQFVGPPNFELLHRHIERLLQAPK